MKPPFPWFGGKRRVATEVWSALGDVDNYVEPFAGSLACLLARPAWHSGSCETVNDADAMLCNFWRSVTLAPEETARWCDWPVNETDLLARHAWLVERLDAVRELLESDPDAFDAKVAGWWVWGINSWIGSGWCAGTGPWRVVDGAMTDADDAGRGVNRQRPHLGNAGQGVNRQLPHLGSAGQGVADYFIALATRLRRVRVCCGDWSRVVTAGALAHRGTVGVLLDPPYLGDVRTADLYANDDHAVANVAREWALANGNDPRLRIVLCGYEPEHAAHMPRSWTMIRYSSSACYQTARKAGTNDEGNMANRHLERLWLSPHCLTEQPSLFAEEAR